MVCAVCFFFERFFWTLPFTKASFSDIEKSLESSFLFSFSPLKRLFFHSILVLMASASFTFEDVYYSLLFVLAMWVAGKVTVRFEMPALGSIFSSLFFLF